MEFLDKLVLPQSAEHLELLHYISILLLTIVIPYLSLIFGGTILSLNYFRKSYSKRDSSYLQFAKDVLQIVSINNLSAVALGILPLFTLILVYSQIFNKTGTHYTSDLFLAFLFITVGLLFIYTFRITFSLDLIFKNVEENSLPEISKQDYNKIKSSSAKILSRYGYFGIVFLFAGIWILAGVLTAASNFEFWQPNSFISMLFSIKTIVYLLLFICFSFALTGSYILFYVYFWNKENYQLEESYKEQIIKINSRLVYYSSLFIPILILFYIYLIPKIYLGGNIFAFSFFVLILVLVALSLNHYILNKFKINYNPLVFFSLLLAVFSLIVQKETLIKNATESNALILSAEYNKILAELKGSGTEVAINAAEIYQVKCAACHQFDKKLVGPAHLDVLPKYDGKINQLVAFIRNPVKVDPAYPPMPNPGLKPNEAEAVAQFLLDEYQKLKK
jgi:cytochrome c